MKKLLSFLITVVMLMQCAVFVHAADPLVYGSNVSPTLDMELDGSGSGYTNGPIRVWGASVTVNYRTTLNMSAVLTEFEKWYSLAESRIDLIANGNEAKKAELTAVLENLEVDGEFEVKITYPKTFLVPAAFITGGNMYGFNDEAKVIFEEVSTRTLDQTSDAANDILTIKVKVKGATGGKLKAKDLFDNKASYLADMTLTAEGVTVQPEGTYTVRGEMTGYTEAKGTFEGEEIGVRVNYAGVQDPETGKVNSADTTSISATVELLPASAPSSGGGSGRKPGSIVFTVDGKVFFPGTTYGQGTVKVSDLPKPEKAGFVFDGWYYDNGCTNKVSEDIVVNIDKVNLYGRFISENLESEDHFAYIIGYPDGTVKPTNNITREEVATIFYRLLREEKLVSIASTTNNFSDVDSDRWSNKAISSLANGGYVKGYEDGSFRPERNITRAEFAAMATRYASLSENAASSFSDISGHWAEDSILKAANAGWVAGYEDGTFAPERNITRAEVMTIVNRMLRRKVDAAGLHENTKLWSDMNGSEWYFYDVLEATNAHNYERREDGELEKWTEITENKIWVELDEMENE